MVPALATTPPRTSLQVVLGNRKFKDSEVLGRVVVLGNREFKDSEVQVHRVAWMDVVFWSNFL